MTVRTNNAVFDSVELADNFRTRLIGLMGKKKLLHGQGLLLQKCSRVHSCFMRVTIDIVYLNNIFEVLDKETLIPWKIGKKVPGAKNILELPQGEAKNIVFGEKIIIC